MKKTHLDDELNKNKMFISNKELQQLINYEVAETMVLQETLNSPEFTDAYKNRIVGNIYESSSTFFDIACGRFKVTSLNNSFFTIEQDLVVDIPKLSDAITIQTYYIDYKYAADVINQYRISSNNELIQTQNHTVYEWYMQYNSVSNEAKENSDLYATYKEIQDMDSYVPGVYINAAALTAASDVKVHLKL